MANYVDPNDPYWQNQSAHQSYNFDTTGGFTDMPPEQLDFRNFNETPNFDQQNYGQMPSPTFEQKPFMEPAPQFNSYPNIFTPSTLPPEVATGDSDFDEPPLLDELEIYPDRILEKTLAVLNPFHGQSLADDANFLLRDTDIAGPIAFCLTLGVFLFLSGNKAQFGYVYGLSMISVVLMYCLLSLMSRTDGVFTVLSVASVLGYCLLPVVALSGLGVVVSLEGPTGFSLAGLAVLWSTLSASRLFVTMTGDKEQRPLIAYPCALVNGIFALLVVF